MERLGRPVVLFILGVNDNNQHMLGLLLLPLTLAAPESRVYCNTSYYCPSSQTCCPAAGKDKWMCCQFGAATCCSDQQHCCPADYPVCDVVHGQCLSSGLFAFAYNLVGKNIEMERSQSAIPHEFDARREWQDCVDDREGDSVCEEFVRSPVSVVADRVCIAGKGHFSVEQALASVWEKLTEDPGCDDTLFDYTVLHLSTYGLPGRNSRIPITVENISLIHESRIKREISVKGPVSIKLEDRRVGKLVGWTEQDWVVLSAGAEVLVPIGQRGLVTVFKPKL